MFNLGKEKLKAKADEVADNAQGLVKETSQAIKGKAQELKAEVSETADKAKYEANDLITNLKYLVNEYSDAPKVNRIKNQIADRASELSSAVIDEVSNAYNSGKNKASETVRQKPLATLALIAGAGLVIGYIFGARESSK